MLKANAYQRGVVAPKTMATATPPNDTCAKPSPIRAKFLISKNKPRKPDTTVTINAAINER